MKRPANFAKLPDAGLPARVQRVYAALRHDLRLDAWFPHAPLAVVVALFGLLKISPEIPRALGLHLLNAGGAVQSAALMHSAAHGVPAIAIGVFLIIMAIGLQLRSRLAWVIVLLILATDLALSIADYPATSGFMLAANAILLIAALAAYRSFQRSSVAAGTLFAVTSIVLLLAYAVFGSYELGAEFKPPITDLATAVYFSVVTMTTVGYGDITPQTIEAKLFVVSFIILAVAIFAVSLGAILVPVINGRIASLLRPGERKMQRSDHYVIVGKTPLAYNTYKELHVRGQQVTFVHDPSADHETDGELDVVTGNPSDLDVLRRAGAEHARAVLALSEDDAENAFVVLAMRELAEKVKTVAVVHHTRNLASVKRVHPDLIVSPQILGGELLAMALSGEDINTDTLLDQLLHFRA
ncbi:MAG TPA: voltage-gated potassium channel protein [Gammaproteobacteria bacterium]|nr:voltage-gated potassium channel protein [Gammaproteobacteria bacterium]